MTVEELVQELQQFDASAEVIVRLDYVAYSYRVESIEADATSADYHVNINAT